MTILFCSRPGNIFYIHYSGAFVPKGHNYDFVDGKSVKTTLDINDTISYGRLVDIVQNELQCSKINKIYYKVPRLSISEGLRQIDDDNDVIQMCTHYVIHIFVGPIRGTITAELSIKKKKKKRVITCSKCWMRAGHNRKTCKVSIILPIFFNLCFFFFFFSK